MSFSDDPEKFFSSFPDAFSLGVWNIIQDEHTGILDAGHEFGYLHVEQSISAESNAAPVRLEVSVPESISTKNKVVQRIGIQLYPTYVMQNVLFQRVSGESVTANPSGILSVKGTGTTKFYVIPPQNTEVWKEVDVTVRQPLIRLTSSGKMRLSNKVRIV